MLNYQLNFPSTSVVDKEPRSRSHATLKTFSALNTTKSKRESISLTANPAPSTDSPKHRIDRSRWGDCTIVNVTSVGSVKKTAHGDG